MICELCGQEVPRLVQAEVEGSLLNVCSECAHFGKVHTPGTRDPETGTVRTGQAAGYVEKALERRQKRQTPRDIYDKMGPKELVDDYGDRVRKARTRNGMTPEDLGRKINERKSVINQIESYTIHPDEKVIKKLERALGLSLMEISEGVAPASTANSGRGMTLGDLIKYEDGK